MPGKTKSEVAGFFFPEARKKEHRLLKLLICSNLLVGAGAVVIQEEPEQAEATVSAGKAPRPLPRREIMEQRVSIPAAPPVKAEVVQRLGERDLTPVPDPDSINRPNEIMITADNECGVQIAFEADESRLILSAYIFGRISDITNKETYIQNGMPGNPTAHAEGEWSLGVVVPRVGDVVDQTLDRVEEAARFCENFVPPNLQTP